MLNEISIEVLQHSPLVNGLSQQQCQVLLEIMEFQTLEDDELLIKEGEVSSKIYGIYGGKLAVHRQVSGNESIVLHILKKGDIAGEMGFIDNQPHSASLKALGETHIFSISQKNFEQLVPKYPDLIYIVMKNIVKEVHNILKQMNLQHVEFNNYINKQYGRY